MRAAVTRPVLEDPSTVPTTAAIAVLVEAEAEIQQAIEDNLVDALLALWAAFGSNHDAFYTGTLIQQFVDQTGMLVRAAQQEAGRITEAYLREQIRSMGETLPNARIVDLPRDLRLGVSVEDTYQRPVRDVRYLESTDVEPQRAMETARERLERVAETDLQLARTISAQQVMYRFPQAIGWRRIIHPELGRVCGLCIAASDRVYGRIEKMDMHPACKCTILPVIGGMDPGRKLNEEDLTRLYEAAGSTEGRALSKLRIETKQNGELGPILTPAGTEFKSPKTARQQLSPDAQDRRRNQLQRQVDELRSRERMTDWHQARLEQLESLLEAAQVA